ncbi:MAG TPA: hypothetical protein VFS24_17370 [Steroidobacteraceae bacterium]|nr:hypothetical protein [Steroidobacteraceae bacterium]
MTDPEYRFGTVQKDPGEDLKVELNLFRACANFWQPNEQYGAGEFVRPTRGTGFSYEVTTAGTTSAREPIWPTTEGATVTSGSAVLTCRAADTNGLNAITSPSATSDPIGLTISDLSVSESVKILATYSGGTLDQDFDAVYEFTLNGVTRIARQRVEVRKR